MADPEQLGILERGVEAWNQWRYERPPREVADLSGASFSGKNLDGAHLSWANLSQARFIGTSLYHAQFLWANLTGADLSAASIIQANLSHANLSQARFVRALLDDSNFNEANLSKANLSHAQLIRARLNEANLMEANLVEANLSQTDLSGADLDSAELAGAHLSDTVLGNTNLASVSGLESCLHSGPSTLDHRTLIRSGPLSLVFLRGVGLPDRLIDYLPSLLNEPLQFYACFISYSSKDQAFAERLHADLQNKGVRCWYAPHDLPIGAKTRPAIDEAIREYDKLLLVLSKHSVGSAWVEHEIERALAKELRTRKVVLFPVRLDDAIKTATTPWAQEIREDRNIGDMRRWRNNQAAYQKAFERVLRDLRTENAAPAPRTEA